MVLEINPKQHMTLEQILRREHAASSGAKKVIGAPVAFAAVTDGTRSKNPVNATLTAASAEMTMEPKKAYRLIGSQDLHFRMSDGTSAAVVTDIFLPAGQPITIQSGDTWDKVSVIRAATATADGLAQLMEVI